MTFDDDDIFENGVKPVSFMSESEKEETVLRDKDGTPLYYNGKDRWIPVTAFVSREEILKAKSHYPKPRLYPLHIIYNAFIPFLLLVVLNSALFYISKYYSIDIAISTYLIVNAIFLAFYLLLNLKNIIIFCILLYQKYAKDEVRERCHMTPSCSFYTIYALEKYGLIIGSIKALKRFKKCCGQEEEDWP